MAVRRHGAARRRRRGNARSRPARQSDPPPYPTGAGAAQEVVAASRELKGPGLDEHERDEQLVWFTLFTPGKRLAVAQARIRGPRGGARRPPRLPQALRVPDPPAAPCLRWCARATSRSSLSAPGAPCACLPRTRRARCAPTPRSSRGTRSSSAAAGTSSRGDLGRRRLPRLLSATRPTRRYASSRRSTISAPPEPRRGLRPMRRGIRRRPHATTSRERRRPSHPNSAT